MLDECVPRPLALALRERGQDATAFPNAWKQLPDGALITRAVAAGYAALITGDKSMPFQQSVAGQPLAVLVLPTTHVKPVLALADRIANVLERIPEGAFSVLTETGFASPIGQ